MRRFGRKLLTLLMAAAILAGMALPVSASDSRYLEPYNLKKDMGTFYILEGEQIDLAAEFSFTNRQSGITWSSDRTKYATVDQNGTVTGMKVGYAHITAEYYDAEANLRTTKAKVRVGTGVGDGKTFSFTVKEGHFLDLSQMAPIPETVNQWSSNHKAVMTVDENGLLTTHKAGTGKITVISTDSAGNEFARVIEVKVASPNSHEVVFPVTITMDAGDSLDLDRMFYPGIQTGATFGKFSCTTADSGIVSVSGAAITAKSAGAVNVVFRYTDPADQEYSRQITVKVNG